MLPTAIKITYPSHYCVVQVQSEVAERRTCFMVLYEWKLGALKQCRKQSNSVSWHLFTILRPVLTPELAFFGVAIELSQAELVFVIILNGIGIKP